MKHRERWSWVIGIAVLVLLSGAAIAADGPAAQAAARATLARPLLIGEWADIAVLKEKDDYYLVHSSGWYRPAVLIWHSKDLRIWRPLRYAVEEFDPGPIWVTDLAKIGGRYYLFFLKDFGYATGGHVLTADAMAGPWSAPRATGLHPDAVLAADEHGKRFILSGIGHYTPLADDALTALEKPRRVYEGWLFPTDWAVEMYPCVEAPKILRRDGWWHLVMAQGGTFGPATSHMVVSARAKSPDGPWENSPHNPILRTVRREEPWWSKGHGQLIEGPGGQWYCISHGIMNGFRSLGRCTLIEPIEWTKDGWFKVAGQWPADWDKPVRVEMPLSDEFDGKALGIAWQFYRQYDRKRFALGDGKLTLQGRGEDPGASFPLTIQPMHRAYEIQAEVEIEGEATAGLMLFATPESYIGSAIGKEGIVQRVQKGHQRYRWMKEPRIGRTRVELRIVNDRQDARFYYKDDAGAWQIIQPSMDVSQATSSPSNLRPALFVSGKGSARFSYFRYTALERDEERDQWLEGLFRTSQEKTGAETR